MAIRSLARFPLSVVATTTVESALADWRAQTKFLVIAAGLSADHRRYHSRADRPASVVAAPSSQNRVKLEKQRLDTAVENMTQGLTLFDRFKRLVVCNQRYIEMYGLSPEVVKPGCHLRDLISPSKRAGIDPGRGRRVLRPNSWSTSRAERSVTLQIRRRTFNSNHAPCRCPTADGSPRMKTSPNGTRQENDDPAAGDRTRAHQHAIRRRLEQHGARALHVRRQEAARGLE